MIVLRAPVVTALALLIVSGGYDFQSGSASARSTSLLQLFTGRDTGRQAAEHHGNSNEHQAQSPLPTRTELREGKEVNISNQNDQTLEVIPRDLRQKEKFLKHLTGPLYFSPKCSKHFYRLYNYTRDCTIPACKLQKMCSATQKVIGAVFGRIDAADFNRFKIKEELE